jgi:hypothetical protein
MEMLKGLIEYLVGVQFHPMVTAAVFFVIWLGKQRWEEPHVILAKQAMHDAAQATPEAAAAFMQTKCKEQVLAEHIANTVMLVGWAVSIVGEFVLYWPKSLQSQAICAFMSLAQVGAAWFAYFYMDKWGIADHIGFFMQKRIDKQADI